MEFPTVTQHCPICGADVEMPADMLTTMAEMPRIISRSFREPRPLSREAGWSPHEIAAHLADVEVVEGWRLRQTLAVDEPELQPFDQDAWAAVLHYGTRELATSLATYAANRQANVEIMRTLDQAGWERRFRHAEFGHLPLRALVQHISDHDILHLKQIRGE
jgi:hypothetical protein